MHISTQGLVLREVNYKESDKLLTVLTAEGGKRTVKARGCRRRLGLDKEQLSRDLSLRSMRIQILAYSL